MRPSLPVRHRTRSWNDSWFSTADQGGAGFALGRKHHLANAEFAERFPDGRFAIAAVGGDRVGDDVGPLADALDRRSEHGGVGWVADEDGVVDDDAVLVVDHLGLVTELNRFTQPTLADGPGVRVVQRHQTGGPHRARCRPGVGGSGRRCGPPALRSPRGRRRRLEPGWRSPAQLAESPSGVDRHPTGLADGVGSDAGHAGIDGHDLTLCLLGSPTEVGPIERA